MLKELDRLRRSEIIFRRETAVTFSLLIRVIQKRGSL
jgi:hypothetical protein